MSPDFAAYIVKIVSVEEFYEGIYRGEGGRDRALHH